MTPKQIFIRKTLYIAIIGAALFLSFATLSLVSLPADAQGSEECIIPPGGTKEVCPGSISYPIAQLFDASNLFAGLLRLLVGIVVTAAFFYFFWNLVKYIRDEEGKEEAKTKMGYSLGAIFVIVTLWGIIGFIRGVLGVGVGEEQVNNIALPEVGSQRCGGGSVSIRYINSEGRPARNADGNSATCVKESDLKSPCCKNQTTEKKGYTKCKKADGVTGSTDKCDLVSGDCPADTNKSRLLTFDCS